MNIVKYPTEEAVSAILGTGNPLLMLVSFDGEEVIVGDLDASVEHHILLAQTGHDQRDIDKYFRLVLDNEGADWTFVCPPDYKSIPDKVRRISAFYRDGFAVISHALAELGYMVGINIPRRYRRHFDIMSGK
ncbi:MULTISPECIES: hypothetical protein [Eubacteriales]|uniref:Uncharacterized protein n=1 Tax=Bittarella massiliensis (ex Durand et al. 2017) TaxID=1720313 RepID=A0AAQ1MDS0_9FIRM|nr:MULTISPECIES: hypothetical protein [Eubacteriales]ERJ00963.1 hypothetical protein HMPREF0262_00299 [Clostridium sp. ATCC 29733]SHG16817.1 hypothetical protein SAMN05444424_1723 [Bittarella massiliensis (ex Durand et al. 2017)]SHG17150.1 hypothetical protein SAMN05444424_1735 [Bittarella massiliensis (ex Durand et al. 2017)]